MHELMFMQGKRNATFNVTNYPITCQAQTLSANQPLKCQHNILPSGRLTCETGRKIRRASRIPVCPCTAFLSAYRTTISFLQCSWLRRIPHFYAPKRSLLCKWSFSFSSKPLATFFGKKNGSFVELRRKGKILECHTLHQ